MLNGEVRQLIDELLIHANSSLEKIGLFNTLHDYLLKKDYVAMYECLAYFLSDNKNKDDKDLFIENAISLFIRLNKHFEPLRKKLFSAISFAQKEQLVAVIYKLPEPILNQPLDEELAIELKIPDLAEKTPLQCVIARNAQHLIPDFLSTRHNLLKEDVDVKLDNNRCTLLHYVCQQGDRDLAQYLLDQGADVNAKCLLPDKKSIPEWVLPDNECTPVDLALKNKDLELYELLKANGAWVTHNQKAEYLKIKVKLNKQKLVLAKTATQFDSHDLVQTIVSRIYCYDDNHRKTIETSLRKLVTPDSVLRPMLELIAYAIQNHDQFDLIINKQLRIFIVEGTNISSIKAERIKTLGLRSGNSIYVRNDPNEPDDTFAILLHELKHYADLLLITYFPEFKKYEDAVGSIIDTVRDFLELIPKDSYDETLKRFSVIFEAYQKEKYIPELSVKVAEIIGALGYQEGKGWLERNLPSVLKIQDFFNEFCTDFLINPAELVQARKDFLSKQRLTFFNTTSINTGSLSVSRPEEVVALRYLKSITPK